MRRKQVLAIVWMGIILLSGHPVDAQPLSNGPIGLQSYVGTWKYESANETVLLRVRDTVFSINQMNIFCIVGTYSYTKNDITIIDNMNMFNSGTCPIHMPIYCVAAKPDELGNIFNIVLVFKDTKTGKTSSDCEIRYSLGHSAPQLTWHLVDEGDLIIWENFGSDDEEYNEVMRKKKLPGWSVPNNITFVKVE